MSVHALHTNKPETIPRPSHGQLALNCVVSQLRVRPHSHLLENPGPVRANGAVTERQESGDFADRLPRSNEPHHLKLPIGETLMGLADLAGFEIADERFSKTRTHVSPACDNPPDRLPQLGR